MWCDCHLKKKLDLYELHTYPFYQQQDDSEEVTMNLKIEGKNGWGKMVHENSDNCFANERVFPLFMAVAQCLYCLSK